MKFKTEKVCKDCKQLKLRKEFATVGKSARCKSCENAFRRIQYAANPKPKALYYIENKEKIDQYKIAYRLTHKDKMSSYQRKYNQENAAKRNARNQKRKAAKLNRVPKWLTSFDLEKIQEYHDYANLFTETSGIQYDVDHIIPLLGKNISGLHCPENLQIIMHQENIEKGNKFPYLKD
jgi:hypothetical protein